MRVEIQREKSGNYKYFPLSRWVRLTTFYTLFFQFPGLQMYEKLLQKLIYTFYTLLGILFIPLQKETLMYTIEKRIHKHHQL